MPLAGRLSAVDASPEDLTFFESRIRPLLAERCFSCHSEEKQKGHLRLDSLQAMLAGGENGPASFPGTRTRAG